MEIKSTNFIVETDDILGDSILLKKGEAHHLVNVMRAGKGDVFYAVDGKGKKYRSVITTIVKDKVSADVISVTRNDNEPLIDITLGIPLLKGNVMDYALEKATECGANKFIPYSSTNTVVEQPEGAALTRKMNRWRNLIVSAVKQSLRSRIPVIDNPLQWGELIESGDNYPVRIIADSGRESIPFNEVEFSPGNSRIMIIAGPEAGFTVGELADARDAGFKIVRLGSRRLRAETASAILPLLIQYIAGELN